MHGLLRFDVRGKDRRGGKTSGRTNAEQSYSGTFSEERRPLLSRALPYPFTESDKEPGRQSVRFLPNRTGVSGHRTPSSGFPRGSDAPALRAACEESAPLPRRSPASAKQARARPEPRPRVRPHPNRTGLNSCDQYLLARSAFPALSAARTTDSFCLPGSAARASVSLAARTAARPASSGTFGETTSERTALPAFP